ncbi:MAG: ATP-binding cassette domain-containing protein [Ilumatobacteraceae bacterium]
MRTHQLTKRFASGLLAVDGIDLDVREGDLFGFLGPNGAGKTTLMLHLNGILRPAVGDVRIGGRRVDPGDRRGLREIRRRVGLVFQDPDDQLFMPTVRADVAFGPANHGLTGIELTAWARRCGRPAGEGVLARHAPALGLRRRCCAPHACWCSTSPPTASTRRASTSCARCSSSWCTRAPRSCCRRTCWPRSSSSAPGRR